jgi:hypothetical protein
VFDSLRSFALAAVWRDWKHLARMTALIMEALRKLYDTDAVATELMGPR